MSQTLRYLRYSLPPLVLMLLPMILIAAQVEARFGYRSFEPGEPVLLRLVVDGSEPVSGMEPALSLPAGLIQATPPLRAEKSREILWRIEARQKGEYRLEIELAGGKVEKRLLVETPGLPLAPVRLQAGELASLLFPSEPPLGPSGQIRAVWLDYPRSGPDFAGLSAPTWGLFGFTLLLGFLFRSFFGVTF